MMNDKLVCGDVSSVIIVRKYVFVVVLTVDITCYLGSPWHCESVSLEYSPSADRDSDYLNATQCDMTSHF